MKYSFSTTGDVSEYPTPQQVKFPPSMSKPDANVDLTPSQSWLPSAVLFQDNPYYIRNSLLSPNAKKPRVPKNSYPTDKNGLFANAGGSDFFLSNTNDNKYADAQQSVLEPTSQPVASAPLYKRK